MAYNFPDMPEGWQDHELTASDGTQLYWGQTHNLSESKATIVLVTDFKSSLLMKSDEIHFMIDRGYHVIGLDQRGQGRSGNHRDAFPEKLYVDDYYQYADDLAQLLKTANIPKERTLILTGNSFGAATITRMLGEFPNLGVDGALLLVPAYQPKTWPLTARQFLWLGRYVRFLGKGEFYIVGQSDWKPYRPTMTDPTECASNPSRLYYTEALSVRYPEQRIGGGTWQWVTELLENGQIISDPDFGQSIDIPIEMVLAETDIWVENKTAEQICTESLARCQLSIIPETGHCITMEHDHVLDKIYDRLDRVYERAKLERGRLK